MDHDTQATTQHTVILQPQHYIECFKNLNISVLIVNERK